MRVEARFAVTTTPWLKVLGDWGKDKFLLRDLSRFLAEIEQPTTFYRPLLIQPSGLLPVESGKAWFPQPLQSLEISCCELG